MQQSSAVVLNQLNQKYKHILRNKQHKNKL